MSRNRIIRKSGCVHDSRSRRQAAKFLNECRATHVRHHEIRDDQPKRNCLLPANLQRLIPVTRGCHSIPRFLKNCTDEIAHGSIIFYDQNRLRSGLDSVHRSARRGDRRSGFGTGQIDLEGRPVSQLGFQLNLPAILLHDAGYDRQAQALFPLPDSFVVKNGSKTRN